MHLRTNNQAILTRLDCLFNLIFVVPWFFFVVYFLRKLSAAMPPDTEGSVAKSGKVTHNEELRLLCALP